MKFLFNIIDSKYHFLIQKIIIIKITQAKLFTPKKFVDTHP